MANFADALSGSGNPFMASQRQRRSVFNSGTGPSTELDSNLLSDIGSVSLSGLARVGNFLDIPGSVGREAVSWLAGNQDANPFDQLLPWNWTTAEHRVGGRDLNRQLGFAGPDDTYGNWWGGVATEIALDPLTYLSGGLSALSKSGKVAQAAGVLGDAARLTGKGSRLARLTTTLGELAAKTTPEGRQALDAAARAAGTTLQSLSGETLGSLGKFGIGDFSVHFGTGPLAQRAAGALDVAGGWLGQTAPARFGKMLFDPEVMGQFSVAGQDAAREIYRGKQVAERSARLALADVLDDLTETRKAFIDTFGQDIEAMTLARLPGQAKVAKDAVPDTFERLFGLATELGGDLDTALGEFGLAASKATPELRQKLIGLGDKMQQANKAIHTLNMAKGGRGGMLEELTAQGALPGFEHFPRYVKPDRLSDFQRSLRNFATRHGSTFARDDVISHISQEHINRMLVDPNVRAAFAKGGSGIQGAAQAIANKYGSYLGKGTMKDAQGNVVPRWASIDEHAKAVAKWVEGHREWALFTRAQVENFFKYQRGAHLAGQAYDSIHALIERNILGPGVDGALVEDVYKAADMNVDQAATWLGQKIGMTPDQVKALTIPVEVAKAIAGSRKALSEPEWAGQIGRSIDYVTDIFKRAVTLPFPSFWTRNLTSGQYVNLTTGLIESGSDLSSYGRYMHEAFDKFRRGLDPAYERELMIERVLDPDTLFEGVTHGSPELGKVAPTNPFTFRDNWLSAGTKLQPSVVDRVPGGRAARQGYEAWLTTGAKASKLVEYMNRVPMYEYLKSKGWSPQAAAAKVRELQIDYGALAPFEKQVMRRLVPFYSFQRKIAPVIMRTLADQPGGPMAQTIRLARDAGGADAMTPDYVAETLSIPNPFETETDGTRSYWSGFGLPFEQHLQYLSGVRDAGRETLSQLNPLVKAPLEYATNQSFFQRGPAGAGRPLDELDPTIGRTISNAMELTGLRPKGSEPVPTPRGLEFLVGASPASRFTTTARQLSDPRKSYLDKALNALTGVRVTDVSPAAQDAVLRDRSIELMRDMDARTFERVYFPDWMEAKMSPEELERARRLEALQTTLVTRAKQRAATKKAGKPGS